MVLKDATGQLSHPLGAAPAGYLKYTGDGEVFVITMRAARAPIGTPVAELLQARATGKMFFSWKYLRAALRLFKAATACTSYCGTYEVQGNVVAHHVRASLFPDWTGTTLLRSFSFSDDELCLTAQVPAGGELALVWTRAAEPSAAAA
jgi:hypothetical protein